MLIAAMAQNLDVQEFIRNALKILWVDDLDIKDSKVMMDVANKSGLDGEQLLKDSANQEIDSEVNRLTEEAVKRQVFGTPFFFYRDEPFWGQDRLDLLEDAIQSDRDPIPFRLIA
jgi:2-hydroxychromene-2-carboxylate isomerase